MFSGDMRNIPSFKIYDYAGNLNKASSDGTNRYSADPILEMAMPKPPIAEQTILSYHE